MIKINSLLSDPDNQINDQYYTINLFEEKLKQRIQIVIDELFREMRTSFFGVYQGDSRSIGKPPQSSYQGGNQYSNEFVKQPQPRMNQNQYYMNSISTDCSKATKQYHDYPSSVNEDSCQRQDSLLQEQSSINQSLSKIPMNEKNGVNIAKFAQQHSNIRETENEETDEQNNSHQQLQKKMEVNKVKKSIHKKGKTEKEIKYRLAAPIGFHLKTKEDYARKSAYKNQIKGFISKYVKRLNNDKEVFEAIPWDKFSDKYFINFFISEMKGQKKKTDLFLMINKFSTLKEDEEKEIYKEVMKDNCNAQDIEEESEEEEEKKDQENEEIDDDVSIFNHEKAENEERKTILKKEIQTLLEFQKNYSSSCKEDGRDSEIHDNFEGYVNLATQINYLTVYFRSDILRYLQSQQYITKVFDSGAQKFDQLYIKNIILDVLKKPSVLI